MTLRHRRYDRLRLDCTDSCIVGGIDGADGIGAGVEIGRYTVNSGAKADIVVGR